MRPARFPVALSVALSLTLLGVARPTPAQEPGPTKPAPKEDDALGSLLKEIEDDKAAPTAKPPTPAPKAEAPKAKPPREPKPAGGEVSGKDKDLDSLLEKLGETADKPTPDDPSGGPGGPPPADEPPNPGEGKGDKKDPKAKPPAPGLSGKDKDLEEHLTDLTGVRRKKKPGKSGEDGGVLGKVVKEMRDVEQRLGKTDTGEATRKKQQEIVKNLQTLIEQMRAEGGQPQGKKQQQIAMKPGEKPGQSPGQSPGNTGGNAPNAKPQKPADHRSLAGVKDSWGHLPPELRQEMANVFKEEPLPAREDLIRRYYLSVSKKSLNRGE